MGPDEHQIRLRLHYDGSGFAGWQVQPGERTVQGELEAALHRLTGGARTTGSTGSSGRSTGSSGRSTGGSARGTGAARVTAAGRTDSGVHATGQVVGAVVPRKWSATELRRALNAVLPDDVWVAGAAETRDDFHARYDAVARGYTYRLGTAPVSRSPFFRRTCWPLAGAGGAAPGGGAPGRGAPGGIAPGSGARDGAAPGATAPGGGTPGAAALPLDVLNAAAARIVGDHSFRAFARAGQPERGERCTVYAADWVPWPPAGLHFRVVANRFLHHMVRYLVGTMVDVARGRRGLDEIDRLLANEPGLETSPPAPPEGLFLTRVFYGDDVVDGHQWSGEDAADEILS
ncbi:MAG TPA: tRNA pseudouridine(38-40) synthase TruA [Longimicrobiales bacterium]|nr:tRNA pseudouridine(38-40) synthase TruA [Longimicrobiales bacterium]